MAQPCPPAPTPMLLGAAREAAGGTHVERHRTKCLRKAGPAVAGAERGGAGRIIDQHHAGREALGSAATAERDFGIGKP